MPRMLILPEPKPWRVLSRSAKTLPRNPRMGCMPRSSLVPPSRLPDTKISNPGYTGSCPPVPTLPFASVADRPLKSDKSADPARLEYIPNQLRWDPFDHDSQSDFVSGMHLVAGAGDPTLKQGIGVYIYAAGNSMDNYSAFYQLMGICWLWRRGRSRHQDRVGMAPCPAHGDMRHPTGCQISSPSAVGASARLRLWNYTKDTSPFQN